MKKVTFISSTIILFLMLSNALLSQSQFSVSKKSTSDTLLIIKDDGKVGIGTTAPSVELDLRSTSTDNVAGINLGNINDSRWFYLYGGRGGGSPLGPGFYWQGEYPLRFVSYSGGYNELMRISGDGFLGLGTQNPGAKFDIELSNNSLWERAMRALNPDMVLGDALFLVLGKSDDSKNMGHMNFRFIEDASDKNRLSFGLWGVNDVLNILGSGNVGIGALNPSEKLEVDGTVYSTAGGFKFPDETVQITAAVGGSAGNTLDEAYDQGGAGAGRIITADAGAVQIAGSNGLKVDAQIISDGSLYLNGSGTEGGQAFLTDGDGLGGWIIDNFGDTDNEKLRFFRGSGYNDIFNALVINEFGNVGIGTGGPSAGLHVASDNGFLTEGTLNTGSIPAEGEGVRMMWYPNKAAFRAGIVTSFWSTFWDRDSIGRYSIGMGYCPKARGNFSVAIGHNSTAYGENSTALGYLSVASGESSQAFGQQSEAIGKWATTMGFSTLASGLNATAMGINTEATGQYSTAMGDRTVASGINSFAWGTRIEAAGNYSMAIALADMSDLSVAQNNTLAIMGGNVGIGASSPTYKLEVGVNGSGGILISGNDTGDAGIVFNNGGGIHSIHDNNSGNNLTIESATGKDIILQTTGYIRFTSTGNLGIGVNPSSPLDVKGNVTIRDQSTNDVVVELGTGLDYAEGFDVSDKKGIDPGTVLSIDPENPGKLKISHQSYDHKVAGIVAGANNLGSGISLGTGAHDFNVALAGRVYCNVETITDAVKAGDLLTTSDIPGYAKKVTNFGKSPGAVLGKAMESLEKGQKGQILVLVTLQ